MQLPIEYLRTFLAVAATRSFTKAGGQVNRSQSAVSVQIKRLEQEVGRPLFLRDGKKARLTPDGKRLLGHARDIVRRHDDAVLSLSDARLKGVIRFGSPEHYTMGLLPELLAGFARDYPEVIVEMHCRTSDVVRKGLDRGELDIGLCTDAYEGGQVVCRDRLVWAARPGFDPGRTGRLPLAVEEGCLFRDWALSALAEAGIPYRIVYVSRGLSGVLDAARAGLAVTPAIERTLPGDLVGLDERHGLPALPPSCAVLHTARTPVPEHVACFREHLVAAFLEENGASR
jgi:DNA-binding transcriptional LysR family regulator